MSFCIWLRENGAQSCEYKLERPGHILDPRAINPLHAIFQCFYHDDGNTVTLTLQNPDEERLGSDIKLEGSDVILRVYDPAMESIPIFDTTTYIYLGMDGEFAPRNTVILIIHRSVKVIQNEAFYKCEYLKRVILHDDLEYIGWGAFSNCKSLDALFLPPNVKKFDGYALSCCDELNILPMPLRWQDEDREREHRQREHQQEDDDDDNDDEYLPMHERIGEAMIFGCDTLMRYLHQMAGRDMPFLEFELYEFMFNFHRTLPPLSRASLDMHVTDQSMESTTHPILSMLV